MAILVTGGTGTVGSQVTAMLAAAGHDTRVLTRSAEKAASLPEGISAAIGALGDPSTLPAALEGVDRMFLITPLVQDELEQGMAQISKAVASLS